MAPELEPFLKKLLEVAAQKPTQEVAGLAKQAGEDYEAGDLEGGDQKIDRVRELRERVGVVKEAVSPIIDTLRPAGAGRISFTPEEIARIAYEAEGRPFPEAAMAEVEPPVQRKAAKEKMGRRLNPQEIAILRWALGINHQPYEEFMSSLGKTKRGTDFTVSGLNILCGGGFGLLKKRHELGRTLTLEEEEIWSLIHQVRFSTGMEVTPSQLLGERLREEREKRGPAEAGSEKKI